MSGKVIKRYSPDQIREAKGQTNWARLQASGDFEGKEDEPLDVDWSKAELVIPREKTMISVRIDNDLLEFFRAQGKGYQTRINAVLRAYKMAVENRST